MIFSLCKTDIDELINEFVKGGFTTLTDMKRVWSSRKFSYLFKTIPKTNLALFIQSLYSHVIEELVKLRDLVVEAKDKGVEVALAVAKRMFGKKVFIFGAVEFDKASATERINQLTDLQNARVRFAYEKLISETEIEQFIHLDMDNEVDLGSLQKMSIKYAEAKKRAIKGAGESMEIEDIRHIAEEKELIGERMEKLKEKCDSQRCKFDEQTRLDCLTATQTRLESGKDEERDDDGFDELEHLLSER